MRIKPLFILLFSILFCGNSFAQDFIQVPAVIHLSSFISEGKYSIDEIAEIARAHNFKVVAVTDYLLSRLEYGVYPLRKVIKKTYNYNSVFKFGIKPYLELLDRVQKNNPDMVIIPGIEVAPFYYWQGSVLGKDLKLYNWHKHILALGLENYDDLKMLPVLGNDRALIAPFQFHYIFKLWPILVLVIGFTCLFRRRFDYKDLSGKSLGPYSRQWQFFGGLLFIIGILFLYNNFPFADLKFDQYRQDPGVAPYQNFIDYVNQKRGLTFWAHPEAGYSEDLGKVKVITPEHSGDLMRTGNYTGFAVFYEGYKKVGCAGCLWDELLKQYCSGKRILPVWAIGGLSFDDKGDLNEAIRDLRVMLLVRHLNKTEVLEALRQGRMYIEVGKNSSQFLLDEFSAANPETGAFVTMGQTLKIKQKAILRIKGHLLSRQDKPFRIQLIKNGSIVKVFEAVAPFDITYEDEGLGREKKFYYRLQIQGQDLSVVTNPIFVELNG